MRGSMLKVELWICSKRKMSSPPCVLGTNVNSFWSIYGPENCTNLLSSTNLHLVADFSYILQKFALQWLRAQIVNSYDIPWKILCIATHSIIPEHASYFTLVLMRSCSLLQANLVGIRNRGVSRNSSELPCHQ